MKFAVIEVEPRNKNTLKASFKLQVGPMVIENWTYHTKNDKAWVNGPAREYLDDNGERKFYNLVRFPDKDRYWSFQKWACDAVKDELDKLAPVPVPQQQGGWEQSDDIPF